MRSRDEIPSPPYSKPESPVKALSLAMKLEDICLKLGLLGLSAPQVGEPQDIFVYWSNYPSEPKVFSALIGCKYSGQGDKFLSLESCATFPGERFAVMRYSSIDVSAEKVSLDEGKVRITNEIREFSGIEAVLIQHESDHLSGILPDKAGERIFAR